MSVICDKEAFVKYIDGIEKLKHMNRRKGRHKYSLYKCNLCGMYHVTTITKKALTPKKINKYRIDPSEKGKSIKIENVPGMAPIPRQSKPAKDSFQKPATQKLISKEQAEALKKIIDAKN